MRPLPLAAALAALLLTPAAAFAQASPSPYTSATRYDAAGRVTGTISADPDTVGSGNPFLAVRNAYDGAGRLTKVETGTLSTWQSDAVAPASWGAAFTVARTVETQYDSVGQKIRDTLREGATGTVRTITQYSYDNAGRLECTAVRMNPAVFGSLPSSACALGTEGSDGPDRITRIVYNAAGERVQLRQGVLTGFEAAEATWAYNLDGQVTTVIDANGNRATLHYDGHGRQDSWVFPVASGTGAANPATYDFSTQATALATAGSANASDHEDYTYDLNNNRTDLRKRDTRHIAYVYDALNRVTSKTYPQGGASPVYYGYDNRNLQTFARFDSTGGQGVTNTYDGFGRLASTSSTMGGVTRAITYNAYDRDGNRLQLTHPDGFSALYVYDGLDRLVLTQKNGGTAFDAFTYDALGQSATRNYGVGASGTTTYGYDAVGRPVSLAHDIAGTASDVTWSYTRNAASQIGSVTRSNDSYAWTGLYTVTRNYTPNGLNQYGSIATVGGSTLTLTHDANGNLTSDGAQPVANTYSYDIENRMVGVTGAHAATLVYDPLGRLFQLTSGANVIQFVYDGDELADEYDGAGNWLRRYVHGNGSDDPLVWYEGTDRRYLYTDHEGSIVGVINASNVQIATNTYDEYGIPSASNLGRFQYTGQAWLNELGLYYYKARMYSPTLGRFMQTDPVGYEDQFNLYAYVRDDPINHGDPSGECCYESTDPRHDQVQLMTQGTLQFNREHPTAAKVLAVGGLAIMTGGLAGELVGGGALLAGGAEAGSSAGAAAAGEEGSAAMMAEAQAAARGEAAVVRGEAAAAGRNAEGATSGLRTPSGRTFTGRSTGAGGPGRAGAPARVQQALNGVRAQSLYHGCCGEIHAISEALAAGEEVAGSYMATVRAATERAMAACSSCQAVMRVLRIHF